MQAGSSERGSSSVGRAPPLQGGGRRFNSDLLHQFRRASGPLLETVPRLYEALTEFFDNLDGFSFRLKHTQAFFGISVVKLLRVNGGCLGAERR
jgi:hypothetical protein